MRYTNDTLERNRPVIRQYHTSVLRIDLNMLAHNYRVLKNKLEGQAQIVAIVKANAYGHGMIETVNVAYQEGITFFGVANFDEAITLRKRFPEIDILVLDANFRDDCESVFLYNIQPVIYTEQMIAQLHADSVLYGIRPRVHIKIDTGMGRVGVHYDDAVSFILRMMQLYDNVIIEGLCTHFSAAESDPAYSLKQWERFYEVLNYFEQRNSGFNRYHIANSSATFLLGFPRFNFVRLGILTYGLMPRHSVPISVDVKPVMSWITRVIHCKKVKSGQPIGYGSTYIVPNDTYIATIPIGYADGYLRSLSNRGIVVIGGKRAPVVGRVAMDHCMVDVGPEHPVDVGSEVVLIGRQGEAVISCEELAECAGTIPYEICCNAGKRSHRIYE